MFQISSPSGVLDVTIDLREYLQDGEDVNGTPTVTSQGAEYLTTSSVAILASETDGVPANKGIGVRLTSDSTPYQGTVNLIVGFTGDSGTDLLVVEQCELVDYLPGKTGDTAGRILPSFTVATVPSASPAGREIYVSDETGGAVLAFSDGTNWRRCTDRAVVS